MNREDSMTTEKDTMGEMLVPSDAYWGASTQRAVLNFPISELKFPKEFNHILGRVKRAAAKANYELGKLDKEVSELIVQAADDVVQGDLDDYFALDLFQTGSGTSTNTNANEVIANRAFEIGNRVLKVHPNDQVNMGQSSNDVIPTVSHLTAAQSINEQLIPSLVQLKSSLDAKSSETWEIIKTGRTHLQDATPILSLIHISEPTRPY